MRNPSEAVERHLKQLSIICFAILMGVVIFGGLVWFLVDGRLFVPPEAMPGYLGTVFNLVALVAVGMALLLPRLFPRPGREEAQEQALLAWHKKTTIIGFALREGAALIALVGVLLTGQLLGGYAMAGLAVVTMIFAWPRADQLEAS